MSRTGFVYDDAFLGHLTGSGHPERPDRLEALVRHLEKSELFSDLVKISAEPSEPFWVEQVHDKVHIENVRQACLSESNYLDSDTAVSERSYDIALLAVGGALAACRAVNDGEVDNAFCAVRPPGHHAEPARAMGFCLFNNVAISAKYVQKQYGRERVAIIDWDVHHGNGTQAAFYDDPSVFFCSIHQHPLYPGTGRVEEKGRRAGDGTTLNVPVPPGLGDSDYLTLFEKRILPTVEDFGPDFVFISAGFDAHQDDPLANMELTENGFAKLTALVKTLAQKCCDGRLVSLLEGGYNLQALARSTEVHLQELQR